MRKDDEKKIDEMLTLIREELEELVNKRLDLFRKELQQRFPGPWSIVAERIESTRDRLKDVDWVYVEGAGLVRRELAFKFDLLKDELTDGKGTLRGFFARADSFLGSLGEVFPVLKAVKEYKENVECSIENLDKIKRKGGRWMKT